MTAFTLAELAAEAEREAMRRRRVYPNRIHTRRMDSRKAARDIALMEAIARRLREEEQQWERLI